MNKKLLREYVRSVLSEIRAIDNVHTSITEVSDTDGDGRTDADELNLISKNMKDDEDIGAAEDDSSQLTKLDDQKSFAAKARLVLSILQGNDLLNGDIEKVIGTTPDLNIIRFGLKAVPDDKYIFKDVVDNFYKQLRPDDTDIGGVVELAPNDSPNPSASYKAYMMPRLKNGAGKPLILIFGTAGTTGGARKEGYVYEADVLSAMKKAGLEAKGGTDNSLSDIYLPSANGTLGIEVKLPNAQAGEPTLRYDFDKSEWFASNPKPQNKEIADLINLDELNAENVKKRLEAVKDAVNEYGTTVIGDVLSKVTKSEYTEIVKPALAGASDGAMKGALLATYTVKAATLRSYYMFKNAGLVQVKTKGLFHLHPKFKVTLLSEDGTVKSTELFDFPDAAGAVYFRNFTTNFGIRAQLKNSPLQKLEISEIDLDNEKDRKLFASSVGGLVFPDANKLAAKAAEAVAAAAAALTTSQEETTSVNERIQKFLKTS
jgi:hypothetical protein